MPWIVVTVLGLDAAGIPYAYALYRETCTGAACVDSGRLAPCSPRTLACGCARWLGCGGRKGEARCEIILG